MSEIWTWTQNSGLDTIQAHLEDDGYSHFHGPVVLPLVDEPIALARTLFGKVPIRYQRMVVEPTLRGNPEALPKTMHAGDMHNDCVQAGMPAHVQVMVCERQAADGGQTLLIDLWPVMAQIAEAEPELYQRLFDYPRYMGGGNPPRIGPTWTYLRGNVYCVHPNAVPDSEIGRQFLSFVDRAPVIEFRCEAGDVYVNNNHRMLHGRRAFSDPQRRFQRFLFWFADPAPTPAPLLAAARQGTARLAAKLERHSFWERQYLGIEPPEASNEHLRELEATVLSLIDPGDSNEWLAGAHRKIRVQEAMLSAALRVIQEPDVPIRALPDRLATLVAQLQQELR